jgi:hypothetical protein
MTPVALLLAVTVAIGMSASSCTFAGSGFSIDDLSDHVVVTNASAAEDASVTVTTSLGSVDLEVPAGTSRAVWFLASPKYTLALHPTDDPSSVTYRHTLLSLRDKLETLTLHPENGSVDVAGVLDELRLVEVALQQLHGSQAAQTCSAPVTSGADGTATVTWTDSGLSGGVWTLSCH